MITRFLIQARTVVLNSVWRRARVTQRVAWVCGLLSCSAALAAPAAGQPRAASPEAIEAARGHFGYGVEYYRDGDLESARVEFQRAYDKAPNYRLLYNLAQVSQQLRDYVGAQRYFQQYLEQGGADIDEPRRSEVQRELSKLQARVASDTRTTTAESPEFESGALPAADEALNKPVSDSARGRGNIARAPRDARGARVALVTGDESTLVQLQFPTASPPEPPPRDTVPPTPAPGSSGTRDLVLWLGIGSGVLALGTGIAGVLALNDQHAYDREFHHSTTRATLDRYADRAKDKALATDILLSATLAAAITTLIVAVVGADHETSEPAHRTRLVVGPTAIALQNAF